MAEEVQTVIKEFAMALGLDPEKATQAECMAAIKSLQGAPAEVGVKMQEFEAVKETVKRQAEQIAQFQREKRLNKYQRHTEAWTALPGKPADLAVKLADIEEGAGAEMAETVVAQFEAANMAAVAAGVLRNIGRAKPAGATTGAETKIAEFEKAGLSHAKAVTRLSVDFPHLFREYQADNLTVGGNNDGE